MNWRFFAVYAATVIFLSVSDVVTADLLDDMRRDTEWLAADPSRVVGSDSASDRTSKSRLRPKRKNICTIHIALTHGAGQIRTWWRLNKAFLGDVRIVDTKTRDQLDISFGTVEGEDQ